MTINARERVLTSLAHEEPDRVPFTVTNLTPLFAEKFTKATGAVDPFDYFEADVYDVGFRSHSQTELRQTYGRYHTADVERIGNWGTGFKRGSMFHFEHFIPPLSEAESIKEIESYPLPDYTAPEHWGHLHQQVADLHQRGLAAMGWLECTLFEVAWQIRGMENFMVDMLIRPDWIELLLDRIMEVRIFMAEKYAEADVDILFVGDDIATQRDMLMSVEHWCRFFQPRLQKIIAAARRIKPGLHVAYHTDGNPAKVIPALMDAGVDVLNPVQPECIDPKWVKSTYGDKLSLFGTIGTQSVLPFGTPQEVAANVKERIATLKDRGGVILAPTHFIEPEVPVENLIAFVETVKEYGVY
ncbi:MAG: uroporphyrinogen decarboxylase family protein [Limnochordia bacterium]|jgi:uroporphyrinogen decarboxylase